MNYRRIVQILTLVILSPLLFSLYVCPFPVPFVLCRVCHVTECPLQGGRYTRVLLIYLGLFSTSAIFGRAYCGWACPLGTVQEYLHRFKARFSMRHLTKLKYLILTLALMLIATYYLGFYLKPLYPFVTALSSAFVTLRIPIIILSLVLAVLILRPWCRFLCPAGALLSLFNKISVVRINVKEKCNQCEKCLENCTSENKDAKVATGSLDCIRCFECVKKCKSDAISLQV
jgi:polyferredoxin